MPVTTPEERLTELGIELPAAPPPAAAYVPYAFSGNLVFTAGQVAMSGGQLSVTGKLGEAVDVEAGAEAARLCTINVLAQLKSALGDLSRVRRIVKVTVFVASAPGFVEQHLVANGASELFGDILGEAGAHARSAVGVASLPLDSPVEVEAIAEVEG